MNCQCCGSRIEGQLCNICGFIQETFLDRESLEKGTLEKRIAEYKKTADYQEAILSWISSISVVCPRYRYNEEKKTYEKVGTEELFPTDLSGKAYSDRVVKSDQWIAHIDGDMEIRVDYSFAGARKSVQVMLSPRPEEGIWSLTLHLNRDLQLEIGLSTKTVGDASKGEKHQVLKTVDLDLRAV